MTSNVGTLSRRAKAIYGLLVTGSFFVLLECLLTLVGIQPTLVDQDPYVGFESSIPLYVQRIEDGQPWMQTANNKLSYFNAQRFQRKKAEDTKRVFCLGGSTTFGRPYDDRTSFVGWLRELLPHADSGQSWEVINAGGISYASYRVAAVMEELAAYSPDLFIIYTGHNEFLEERTYRDLKNSSPVLRGLSSPLFRTRTYSVAHRLLSPLENWFGNGLTRSTARITLPGEVDATLDHASGPDDYRRADLSRTEVLRHFEFNLNRMLKVADSVGAKVIFVKPASNLKDFSPFKSEHRADFIEEQRQEWARLMAAAKQQEAQGNLVQALSLLTAAKEIDRGYADVHYRIARLQFSQGHVDQARVSFQRAIDADVCPLRATLDIQLQIEQTAIAHHIPLVDFDSVLKNACLETYGHGSPGREYFLDHVHPTVETNRLLALAIIQAMGHGGIVKPDQRWGEDAVAQASRRIESRIDTALQARALTNLAQVLSWAGKQEEAGPLSMLAVELRSDANLTADPESMFYAAVAYATSGNDVKATSLLREVVELEPLNADAQWRLAQLLYDQAQFGEALEHFRHAVRLDPKDSHSYQMLGLVYIKLDRYDDSLAALIRARELAPDQPGLRESILLVRKKLAADRVMRATNSS